MNEDQAYWPNGFLSELTGLLDASTTDTLDADKLFEMYKKAAQEIATAALNDPHKSLADEKGQRAAFEARLVARWGRALDLIDLTISQALETGNWINAEYRSRAAYRQDQKFEALIHLYGRATMTAQEVLVLLRSGYSMGALARWRTLHEIWVVTSLLRSSDAEISKRYLAHEAIESMKAQEEYEETWDALGFDPPDWIPSERERVRESLREEYGSSFLHPYGWAVPLFNGKLPKLRELQEQAQLDHWRGYYRMASHGTHANPKGILWNVQDMGRSDVVWAGPSNAGLADPGQCTLIALANVDLELLQYSVEELATNEELLNQSLALIREQVIYALMDRAIEVLTEIEEEQNAEEERVRELIDRAYWTLSENPGLTTYELAGELDVDVDQLEEALNKAVSRGELRLEARYWSISGVR